MWAIPNSQLDVYFSKLVILHFPNRGILSTK